MNREHLFRASLARAAELVGRTLSIWRPRIGPSAPPSLADFCAALADIAVAHDRCGKEFEHLLAAAHAAGVAEERARIAAIMDHPLALAQTRFAWALARSGGVTPEVAEQALQINMLNAAFAETEQSAQPLSIN